jgi:chaperonin GroES
MRNGRALSPITTGFAGGGMQGGTFGATVDAGHSAKNSSCSQTPWETKPLRPRVTGLCEERLALAHCDCQSENNHKGQEDRMKFRPLHDRVVVKRIDAEDKTAGGIIIPDIAKEKPSQGEITAVGPGGRDEAGKLIPIDLKVGDRVLFGKWSGTEVKIDGQDYLIMKESDLLGVVEKAEALKNAA